MTCIKKTTIHNYKKGCTHIMLQDPLTLYKLIVLYMLNRVTFPLTTAQVSDFILGKEYTNFLTLQQVINELTDAGNMLLMGAYDVCCRRGKKDLLLRQLNDQMENLKMYIHCGNDYDRINAILRFDRRFVTATENQMCIARHDKEMTAIFLAYVYNHKNRSLDWQHNIDRSQTLIQAVAEDDAALVHEILCARANPHF